MGGGGRRTLSAVSRPLAAVLALVLAALCPACKTVRTVTWESRSSTGGGFGGATLQRGGEVVGGATEARMFDQLRTTQDRFKLEKELSDLSRHVQNNPRDRRAKRQLKKLNEAAAAIRRKNEAGLEGNRGAGDGERLFGSSRENPTFGRGGDVASKRFAGNKAFAGTKEFETPGYQFMRDRELARKEAAAAAGRYEGAGEAAGEAGRRWFGRRPSVDTKTAPGTDRRAVDNTEIAETAEAHARSRPGDDQMLNPDGTDGAPQPLTIEQMRKMMGR